MDLIAIACQEVGLDLTEEMVEVKEQYKSEWIEPWELRISEESGPLSCNDEIIVDVKGAGIVLETQLSFGGELEVDSIESQVPQKPSRPLVTGNPYSSPVTNLITQRKANHLPRRSRPSQQGVPCRNLPALPPQSGKHSDNLPVIEVPTPSTHHDPLHGSNPFLHLFKESQPGQVAFAFYVADCWSSFSSSSLLPEPEQFLSQCHRWWVNLPTPYRRGYWTKEVDYKNKVGMVVVGPRRRNVMVMGKEKYTKNSLVSDTAQYKKVSPTHKNMTVAFKNYMGKNKGKVVEEMVGATGREVRSELGRRWKSLSDVEKKKFIDATIKDDLKQENEVVLQSEGPTKYDVKIDLSSSNSIIDSSKDIDDAPDDNCVKKEEVGYEEELGSIIKLTLEEVDEYALVSNYFIEDEENGNARELSSPERKVLELGSALSKDEMRDQHDLES